MDAVTIASVLTVVVITLVMAGGLWKLVSLINHTHSQDQEIQHH